MGKLNVKTSRLFAGFPCLVLFIIALIYPDLTFSQGRIPKAKDGSFKGALAMFPNSELAKGFHSAASPFPNSTDPMLERSNWVYTKDKRAAVRGMVKDAVLLLQWWTLLNDPIEKYAFKWLTSGYYEVMYEENGQKVTKSISRSQLAKYPDLLKKFDMIEPLNVDVEISFSSGNIDDQKYEDFRRKYKIMTSLGSAGYKASYTIKSLGVHYLYAPSGQDAPFILPTMAVGGWPDFLNVDKKDDERTKRNIELFRLGRELNIHSFKITDFEWQFSPFIEIAKQYERYEKKEDSPKEVAEKAALAKENDGGDDFWNKAKVVELDRKNEFSLDWEKYLQMLILDRSVKDIPSNVTVTLKNSFYNLANSKGKLILDENNISMIKYCGNNFFMYFTGASFDNSYSLWGDEMIIYDLELNKKYRFKAMNGQSDCMATKYFWVERENKNSDVNSLPKDELVSFGHRVCTHVIERGWVISNIEHYKIGKDRIPAKTTITKSKYGGH